MNIRQPKHITAMEWIKTSLFQIQEKKKDKLLRVGNWLLKRRSLHNKIVLEKKVNTKWGKIEEEKLKSKKKRKKIVTITNQSQKLSLCNKIRIRALIESPPWGLFQPQCRQTKCSKIPTGRRQTRGLITEDSQGVEQGATENKSSEWQGGVLEPRTPDYKSSTLATRPRPLRLRRQQLVSFFCNELCIKIK